MHWYNEPPEWTANDTTITLQTASETDFWRITHSGFIGDNGHFYHQQVTGDFQAEVKFSGKYHALYDQAGLMVRLDEATWVKTGIEFIDGKQHASAVVTREFSDWSVVALAQQPETCWLRLKRQGITIEISYSLNGVNYQLLRQAYLTEAESVSVGIMAASPVGHGFPVTFEGLAIQQS